MQKEIRKRLFPYFSLTHCYIISGMYCSLGVHIGRVETIRYISLSLYHWRVVSQWWSVGEYLSLPQLVLSRSVIGVPSISTTSTSVVVGTEVRAPEASSTATAPSTSTTGAHGVGF